MIGEWGEAPAMIAIIATVNLVINSVFILIRAKGDFEG
jgi:hypothetical protein